MDIAMCLAVIDLMCSRDFPAERIRTDMGRSGPGYHIAELGESTGPGDGRNVTAEDVYAGEQAVADRLDERWGRQSRWGSVTLRERIARGEEIPEPWAELSVSVDDLRSWKLDAIGRNIVLAVADRDPEDKIRLLVAVTDVDPP